MKTEPFQPRHKKKTQKSNGCLNAFFEVAAELLFWGALLAPGLGLAKLLPREWIRDLPFEVFLFFAGGLLLLVVGVIHGIVCLIKRKKVRPCTEILFSVEAKAALDSMNGDYVQRVGDRSERGDRLQKENRREQKD